MDITRRHLLGFGSLVVASGWTEPLLGDSAGVLRPEDFGAVGDGVTNDSHAFAALADYVNSLGGGEILLRKATYVVGGHSPRTSGRDSWAYPPRKIMEFQGLHRPLVIRGNGARLKCQSGLRFGTFHPESGNSVERPMPNFKRGELASPYRAMIHVRDCSGSVEIGDLELDGNLPELLIGGQYGDRGWQVPGTGLFLRNNGGSETIRNVYSHHHAQDGCMIDGDDQRSVRSRFERLVSEYNGRQGLSIIGGRGYDFVNCAFNHSGRSKIVSSPGAGVDIEAEGGKTNRDFTFTECEFSNNTGVGMVADSGDSEQVTFERCAFIGTTAWSAWPKKPLFRFLNSTFVGAIVSAYNDELASRACQFHGCDFLDEPRLAPGGKVYLGGREVGTIADLYKGQNVLFDSCEFKLTHNGLLPWSVNALYRDCVMNQRSSENSFPRGTYLGHNIINGEVGLYGSKISGTLILNGEKITNRSF